MSSTAGDIDLVSQPPVIIGNLGVVFLGPHPSRR